jgi:hypothetical protein
MNKNDNLSNARKIKNDEFYTKLTDIEKELMHYKDMFVGKTIYCNCDDPVTVAIRSMVLYAVQYPTFETNYSNCF